MPIHSFRHSLRDRLRAIECPADIIDAIGGWTTEGIGHQYGGGRSLTVLHGWIKLIIKQRPSTMLHASTSEEPLMQFICL